MGDYGHDYQRGYSGGGWNSDTNMSAYSAGQWNRQRELEDAAKKSQGSSGWSTGDGAGGAGGAGGGIALVALMGLGAIGSVVWTLRYLLLGFAVAIVATATALWLLMPLLGARAGWWRVLGQALLACVFAVLGVLGSVAVAWLISWFGGPELISGIHYVTVGMISLFDLPQNTNRTSYIFPGFAALSAATWWLDRKLPEGSAHRGIRRAAIIGLLIVGPIAGLWYGMTMWGSFAPVDFDAVFDITARVSQSDARRSALIAILIGALIVAGVSTLVAKLLSARGWRFALPRKVAVRTGSAYAVYGALLAVMLILFRHADPLIVGMARGLAPNGSGFRGTSSGVGGLVLLQMIPFALFIVIARKAVAESSARRRYALGVGAMLLVLLVTLVVIAVGWLLLFASV